MTRLSSINHLILSGILQHVRRQHGLEHRRPEAHGVLQRVLNALKKAFSSINHSIISGIHQHVSRQHGLEHRRPGAHGVLQRVLNYL